MIFRTKGNYRNRVRLRKGDSLIETETEWGDDDVLRCKLPDSVIEVLDNGKDVIAELISRVRGLGYVVECCATCRYSWYSGLGADCGSTLGNCMEGKIERVFNGNDYIQLAGICDCYSVGSDADRQAVYNALRKKNQCDTH